MDLQLQMNLAENLRILRQNKNLSQSMLADKVSICRSSYCQYELGERVPDLSTLYSLSSFYHVKIDTLIHGNIRQVLSDYFAYEDYGKNELRILSIFANLSDVSKGRLIEKGEQLLEEDRARRRSKFYHSY